MVKADGSVLGARRRRLLQAAELDEPAVQARRGATAVWTVTNKAGEQLLITIDEVLHDSAHELGVDPGLVKDGVEAHLQKLLAEHIHTLGDGLPAGAAGVPDRDRPGRHAGPRSAGRVASRSRSSVAARSTGSSSSPAIWSCSNRDPLLRAGRGVFAAQEIKPQARRWPRTAGSAA